MHEALREALSGFSDRSPMTNRAKELFGALGYHSERTVDIEDVDAFVALLEEEKSLTERQRSLFDCWDSADIVFQVTGEEIGTHPSLFQDFEKGRARSFLFVAADLVDRPYGRTELAEMTRAVNRGFPMPVVVLFRHGAKLTLASVHRRAHKRDTRRDVLERVTLVKDIRIDQPPHRAHLDILGNLMLPRLVDEGVRDFDSLLVAWERVLDIEVLNQRFYADLFKWFQRAVAQSCFPDDGAGKGSEERHVIRLITRVLFIWFMKEKGLIPDEFFKEEFARSALRNHAPDKTDYYRAVLQNLFFATLNTEIDKRAFSKESQSTHRDFTKYRYRRLLADPDGFVEKSKGVPFVNGGLFDCLDDFAAAGEGGQRVDAFTDNLTTQGRDLKVPAHLFFDPRDGLFPLLDRYKFTVEENTPLDQEVALDPELLGMVFENLLAAYNPETRDTARKSTGSYYTPRQVVDYMVHEALTEALAANTEPADGDAEFWRDRLLYLLDHSDAMDDADDLFEENDRRTVVAAIANIQALDPAVGSGAFPMGILQTLTLALRRLDPDNQLWEEFQKERAKARARVAFDVVDQRQRDDALGEISNTFEKYRQSDFGRKLYLIQNSIYGVDIQPIACQIAKLRFFISLVIEQKPDPRLSNFGIKPLPNLETRFVAADTLIGLRDETERLFFDVVESKSNEIAAVRDRYFLADSRSQKIGYIKDEKRLRDELNDALENQRRELSEGRERYIKQQAQGIPDLDTREKFLKKELRELDKLRRKYDDALADARKVAGWDPYDQNTHADWFDPKHMFGVSDGFDIVIGNPPYIQLQRDGGRAGKYYKDAGYETFVRTGDIYQLFYERGCGLLKSATGVLAFITSNSWLKAEYGKPLRRWFADRHTPLRLIELGKDVFENAIVDTTVLVVRRDKNCPVTCDAVDVDQISDDRFPPPKEDWGTLQPEGERPWMALSQVERSVMEKMESIGMPLKDWDISIYYGIKTGCNAAFIVDQATRDALVAADPKSEELLKPVLRGRDIARYRANWADLWLIDMHNGYAGVSPIKADEYPAIKAHLDKFIEHLEHRQDKGITPYNLRNCAYHEEFQKEKLFWMHMAPEGRFALEKPNIICNQKCFMITGQNLDYLCAILNSTLVTWFVKHIAVTTGMGLPQWDKFTVERIPVVHSDPATLYNFRDIVRTMLATRDTGDVEKSNRLQETLDHRVYELYNLTPTEAEHVSRKIKA